VGFRGLGGTYEKKGAALSQEKKVMGRKAGRETTTSDHEKNRKTGDRGGGGKGHINPIGSKGTPWHRTKPSAYKCPLRLRGTQPRQKRGSIPPHVLGKGKRPHFGGGRGMGGVTSKHTGILTPHINLLTWTSDGNAKRKRVLVKRNQPPAAKGLTHAT